MAAGLRAASFSARELTEAHLDRIERTDRPLHAWLWWIDEAALEQADACRRAAGRVAPRQAIERPPELLGIPVALKDLVLTRGDRATAGSAILEGYVSPYDAHISERLKAAGAVLPGKTNMDEFAMGSSTEFSAWGPTANPWDLERVPGGSSGGSAAAVAAYQVPLGIGTDTGGSIRQPAALTGTVGMKPTYGRVSRYGIVAFASSLDQIGPFARDVRDAALLLRDDRRPRRARLDVGAGRGARLRRAAAGERRRGCRDPARRAARPAAPVLRQGHGAAVSRRSFAQRSGDLADAGAEIVDIDLPHTDYGLATYYIIAPAEASANLARYDGIRYGRSIAAAGRRLHRRLPGHARQRLRRRGQAAHHARHLRAVGRLLRRVLPEGAEGAHADQGRLRRRLREGRRARRADQPDGRLPLRRPAGRPGRDVPVGRVHAAGQHGRPAGAVGALRAVGRAAGWPAADRPSVGRESPVRARPGLRGHHRGAAWRALEPHDLAALEEIIDIDRRPSTAPQRSAPAGGTVDKRALSRLSSPSTDSWVPLQSGRGISRRSFLGRALALGLVLPGGAVSSRPAWIARRPPADWPPLDRPAWPSRAAPRIYPLPRQVDLRRRDRDRRI